MRNQRTYVACKFDKKEKNDIQYAKLSFLWTAELFCSRVGKFRHLFFNHMSAFLCCLFALPQNKCPFILTFAGHMLEAVCGILKNHILVYFFVSVCLYVETRKSKRPAILSKCPAINVCG